MLSSGRAGLAEGRVSQVSLDRGEAPFQTAIPAQDVNLREAVIVSRPGSLPDAERTAAIVLAEEIENRTGVQLANSTTWPAGKTVIAITSADSVFEWKRSIPARTGASLPEKRPEGYRLYVETQSRPPVVLITGADARGALFGVGNLLRRLDWEKGELAISPDLDIATSPAYSIRGHQLGYRPQANSYDARSPARFEQYIRELAFFGVNSIEGIPFQDARKTPAMKYPPRK